MSVGKYYPFHSFHFISFISNSKKFAVNSFHSFQFLKYSLYSRPPSRSTLTGSVTISAHYFTPEDRLRSNFCVQLYKTVECAKLVCTTRIRLMHPCWRFVSLIVIRGNVLNLYIYIQKYKYGPAPSLAYGKVHPALHRNGA